MGRNRTLKKHDQNKERFSLLPFDVLKNVTRVMMFGAAKYGDHNWKIGTKWSRYYDATLRHIVAWSLLEDNDPESKLHHLDHALASLIMLRGQVLNKIGKDDRYGK